MKLVKYDTLVPEMLLIQPHISWLLEDGEMSILAQGSVNSCIVVSVTTDTIAGFEAAEDCLREALAEAIVRRGEMVLEKEARYAAAYGNPTFLADILDHWEDREETEALNTIKATLTTKANRCDLQLRETVEEGPEIIDLDQFFKVGERPLTPDEYLAHACELMDMATKAEVDGATFNAQKYRDAARESFAEYKAATDPPEPVDLEIDHACDIRGVPCDTCHARDLAEAKKAEKADPCTDCGGNGIACNGCEDQKP